MPSGRSCGRERSACDCSDCFAPGAELLCARTHVAPRSVATQAMHATRATQKKMRDTDRCGGDMVARLVIGIWLLCDAPAALNVAQLRCREYNNWRQTGDKTGRPQRRGDVRRTLRRNQRCC